MISDSEAYVWIWLPGQVEPVVAGRLEAENGRLSFTYGKSYLSRIEQTPAAIPIYEPELPLGRGVIQPPEGLEMPGCIRDAAPDAWGRRVIINKCLGLKGAGIDPVQLDEITYLLESGSDREHTAKGWARKAVVSALTILGLDDMMARYASYEDFAEIIRHRFANPIEALRELFTRLVFNVLCGNTDDHARNHAAFWDGRQLQLTPAYDICPQGRTGNEASQAMLIAGQNNLSQLATCLKAAPSFLLSPSEAEDIFDHLISTINTHWADVCDEAALSTVDANLLWQRQFLNPFSLQRS